MPRSVRCRTEEPDWPAGGRRGPAVQRKRGARALLPMPGTRTREVVRSARGPCGSVRIAEYRLERRAQGRHQQRFASPGAIPRLGGLALDQADEQHATAHHPAGERQPQDRPRQAGGRGIVGCGEGLASRQRRRSLTSSQNERRLELARRVCSRLRSQATPPRSLNLSRSPESLGRPRSAHDSSASRAPSSPGRSAPDRGAHIVHRGSRRIRAGLTASCRIYRLLLNLL